MVKKVEKEPESKNIIYIKIAFLIGLLVTAFLVFQFSKVFLKPTIPPKSESLKENVLGATSIADLKKSIGETALEWGEKVTVAKNQVQKQAENLLEEKRGEIEASVSATLYDAAVRPVITQFNKLPESQQEEVRGAICR